MYAIRKMAGIVGGIVSLFVSGYFSMGCPPPSKEPPEAFFEASSTSGDVPLSVAFYNYSFLQGVSVSEADFLWEFGDGETSNLYKPFHTYNDYGIYTVTLKVTTIYGSDTQTKHDYITVIEPEPDPEPIVPTILDFTAFPLRGEAPLFVSFVDRSTIGTGDEILEYGWGFGDGEISVIRDATHTYTEPGSYAVTLYLNTVLDGLISYRKENYIVVTEPDSSPMPIVGDLEFNLDPNSNHVARIWFSGHLWDFWVQRKENGDIHYISDIRIYKVNSRFIEAEMYVQVDPARRLSFFRWVNYNSGDYPGHSIRVHNYIEGDHAEVTLSDPYGNSLRGIMEVGLLAPEIYPTKDFGEDLCDMIYSTTKLFETGGLVEGIVAVIGCASSISFDVLTFPTIVESVIGCAGSYAIGTLTSEMMLTGSRGVADTVLECNFNYVPLEEPVSPELPPTTGFGELNSGDIWVSLTWDSYVDLDLYVIDPLGEKIFFDNRLSDSGGILDVDDRDGLGPENIYWLSGEAPRGRYTIGVELYSGHGTNYEISLIYNSKIEKYSGSISTEGTNLFVAGFTY